MDQMKRSLHQYEHEVALRKLYAPRKASMELKTRPLPDSLLQDVLTRTASRALRAPPLPAAAGKTRTCSELRVGVCTRD
ncbi:unnamed protein product [Arctogadus glacialis]